jgi:hypothetical protein
MPKAFGSLTGDLPFCFQTYENAAHFILGSHGIFAFIVVAMMRPHK